MRIDWHGWIRSVNIVGPYRPVLAPDSLVGKRIHVAIENPDLVLGVLRQAIDACQERTLSVSVFANGIRAPRNAHIFPKPGSRVATVRIYRPILMDDDTP